MSQIVPAILEETPAGFKDKAARVTKLPGVKRLHIDFGDGQFIQRNLLSVAAMEALNPAFEWEAHLMVKEPKEIFDYKMAGFSVIIIHYEAFDNSRDLHEAGKIVKDEGLKLGIAINPGTPVEVLKDLATLTNYFLIMGVNPGYQGQEFLPQTIERVKSLRSLVPNAIIEVDGGVNLENIKSIAAAGTDLIVAGSAIVKAADMAEAWEKLNAEVTK